MKVILPLSALSSSLSLAPTNQFKHFRLPAKVVVSGLWQDRDFNTSTYKGPVENCALHCAKHRNSAQNIIELHGVLLS